MLTLRQALRLSCFAQARVVAGERGLDRVVRRVHVVDIPDAQYTWGADALLLTAGYGLRDDPNRRAQLIPTLVERGLSGMVFSVGWYFQTVPPEMCAAADALDLTIIETPPEVQFINITERLYTEIVQEQVARETQANARVRFVQELLREPGPASPAMRERAYALGFPLDKPHQVLFVPVREGVDALAAQIGTQLRGHGPAASVIAGETGAVILVESKTPRTGRQLGEQLVAGLGAIYPKLRIGVSDVFVPAQAAQEAYGQAMEAASIGAQLNLAAPVVDFSELGLLDWLYRLPPETLRSNTYWTKLAALAEHDARTHAELLPTLEMYLEHGGALAEAAAEMNVHRNTMLYRLARVQDLLGMDLKNVTDRLNLHIALKAYRLNASSVKPPHTYPNPLRAE